MLAVDARPADSGPIGRPHAVRPSARRAVIFDPVVVVMLGRPAHVDFVRHRVQVPGVPAGFDHAEMI